jgi:hypothetical protein
MAEAPINHALHHISGIHDKFPVRRSMLRFNIETQ